MRARGSKRGLRLTAAATRMRRHARWVALLIVAWLAQPALAQASSMVYVQNGNVWIAAPDGSHATAVTADGTAADPYRSPSESDAGTIAALRGTYIYRLSQTGRQLNSPIQLLDTRPDALSTPFTPQGAAISPDGSNVAYWFVSQCFSFISGGYVACSRVQVTAADRNTASVDTSSDYRGYPAWIGNDTVALLNGPYGFVRAVNASEDDSWFQDPGDPSDAFDLAVDRTAGRIAVVRGPSLDKQRSQIYLYKAAGLPPAQATLACVLSNPRNLPYSSPTWSPDSSKLAWAHPDGIHVADSPVLDPSNCQGVISNERLILPGGSQPFWSPADPPALAPTVPPNPPQPSPNPVPSSGPAPQCVVPSLTGKTLRRATALLKQHHCRVGSVKRPRVNKRHRGRVVGQSVRPGQVLTQDAPVTVAIGR